MRLTAHAILSAAALIPLSPHTTVAGARARPLPRNFNPPYLGGHRPEDVIGHFRKQKRPYLLVTHGNRDEILRKTRSGDRILGGIWARIRQARLPDHPVGVAFHAALLGGADRGAAGLGDYVRKWNPRLKKGQKWWADYLTAADMMRHLHAFDAARGLGQLTEADEEAFAEKVKHLIDNNVRQVLKHGAWSGNIHESQAIAQCLAAVVLPHHPDALGWFRDGSRYLQMCYDQAINGANAACQAEGQTYQVGFAYQVLANVALPLEEHGFSVVPRDDNFIEEIFDWTVSSLRPNMLYPTTEDAWPRNTLRGIWPARYAGPEVRAALQWHYARLQESGFGKKDTDRGLAAVANLLAYEPGITSRQPARPRTRFLELASTAVFSSGWSADAAWLYFLGDRTPWRLTYHGLTNCANNKPHAHGDQTSFTLFAHGRYLATETARFTGARAGDHNLIIVDNKTEEPSPFNREQFTDLSRCFDTGGLAGATMECSYSGVTNRRSVLYVRRSGGRPETDYFVIFDDFSARGSHTYDWLLHNRENGCKMSVRGKGLALVELPGVILHVHFIAPALEGISIKNRQVNGPSRYKEVYFSARAEARGDVQWLAVLYPRKSEMREPVIETLGTGGVRVRVGAVEDLAVISPGGKMLSAGDLSTDGKAGFLRRISGRLDAFCLRDGRTLKLGSVAVLRSTVPVQVAAFTRVSEDRFQGSLVLDADGSVTISSADGRKRVSKTFKRGRSRVVVDLSGKTSRSIAPKKDAAHIPARKPRARPVRKPAPAEEKPPPHAALAKLYQEAETAFIDGDVERARALFEKVVRDHPESEHAGKAQEYLDILD